MQNKKKNRPFRTLLVAQDFFFRSNHSIHTEWLPLQRSITPPQIQRPLSVVVLKLVRLLPQIFIKGFDFVILPSIRTTNIVGERRLKRIIKLFIRMTLKSRSFSFVLRRILLRGAIIYIYDRDDRPDIDFQIINSLRPKRYFKTNLFDQDRNELIEFLPYWIDLNQYRCTTETKKTIDFFFSGESNSAARKSVPKLLAFLEGNGYSVFFPKARLSFSDYKTAVASARFCLSPEGKGWHCFRHFEAMSLNSIPMINKKPNGLVSDLIASTHYLAYDPDSDNFRSLIAKIDDCIANFDKITKQNLIFCQKFHDTMSIGDYMHGYLISDSEDCVAQDKKNTRQGN